MGYIIIRQILGDTNHMMIIRGWKSRWKMLKDWGLDDLGKIRTKRKSNSSALVLIWLFIGLAFIITYGYCFGRILMNLLEVGAKLSLWINYMQLSTQTATFPYTFQVWRVSEDPKLCQTYTADRNRSHADENVAVILNSLVVYNCPHFELFKLKQNLRLL